MEIVVWLSHFARNYHCRYCSAVQSILHGIAWHGIVVKINVDGGIKLRSKITYTTVYES